MKKMKKKDKARGAWDKRECQKRTRETNQKWERQLLGLNQQNPFITWLYPFSRLLFLPLVFSSCVYQRERASALLLITQHKIGRPEVCVRNFSDGLSSKALLIPLRLFSILYFASKNQKCSSCETLSCQFRKSILQQGEKIITGRRQI